MYMTLAGYGEFPKYDLVDTILYSRRSYEGHLTYHSESARKASDPKYFFEFSRFLDRAQKIVLSHSLKKTEWKNSRIMKGDLNRIVAPSEALTWKGHHRGRRPLAGSGVHPAGIGR